MLKTLSKHNLKLLILVLFLLIFYFIFSAYIYSFRTINDLSNSFYRLHIIANSNSIEDQTLKLKVRDSVLQYLNSSINSNTASKEEIKDFLILNSSNIENIAINTIHTNGYNYPVKIEFGKFNFPTKKYGSISLPSGNYDGMEIKIGDSNGKNWWCVMFPPLCFVDINSGIIDETSKSQIKDSISNEEYALINTENQKNSSIEIKFKLIEFINSISNNKK